jgi:hypothetical protein
MPGKFLKGALIEFTPALLLPLPNVIIFQFNPETMTHTWTPATPAPPSPGGGQSNPLAAKGFPGETFSFTLTMDASDMIADGSPVAVGLATASGIFSRLAALEMLLYPTGSIIQGLSLVGSVSASIGAGGISIGASLTASVVRGVPVSTVPSVLFVWGPGRIVPVRVTSLTVTEKLYDSLLLNPTHAEAQITLTVITPDQLQAVSPSMGTIASAAYDYSQALRQALATANLANAAESIIGMLPIG